MQNPPIRSIQIDLRQAFHEVSASSAGGAPFLITYGATFLITAVLSFFLPKPTTAIIAMFQGALALPAAFWLERRMGSLRLSQDNPLRVLSGQMAGSQALGLPVLILVYSLNPGGIPMALASLGGVHFLPYAWLHRTRLYIYFAAAVSVGAFVIQLLLGPAAFTYILLYVGVVYWIAAPLVYRNAARLVEEAAPA
jgi:hypothetical protein